MDQVQFVDGYRIVGITRPNEQSTQRSLVVWDTTTTKERQLVFEMPAGEVDLLYEPKSLVDHSWAPTGVGLHRSDPARRAVGILCRGGRGKVHEDDGYMVVINAADLCAHALRKNSATTIPWRTWERSKMVIQIAHSVTGTKGFRGGNLSSSYGFTT